jgi:hypothetical protein
MPAAESADLVRGIAATAQADMLADLSPPARVLVTALDVGAGFAVGLGKPLTGVAESVLSDAVSALGDDVAGVVAEVASDVAVLIPVIGPVIKGVAMIIQALVNAFKGPDSGAECQSLFSVYAPRGTGAADMSVVPADIFARRHSVGRWYTEGRGANADDSATERKLDRAIVYRGLAVAPPMSHTLTATLSGSSGLRPMVPFGPARCRSALGMALMQITEGSIVDVREIERVFALSEKHPSKSLHTTRLAALQGLAQTAEEQALVKTPAAVRALWGRALARDNRLAPMQWARLHPKDAPRGLPPAWVNRFRRLRRAIERSGYGSDGGVALWMMYQDLLVSAFDRGFLTPAYVEFLFTRQAPAANKVWFTKAAWFSSDALFQRNSDEQIVASDDIIAAPPTWIWHDDPCPHLVAKVVLGLVERWRSTIHPRYAQGQERLRQLGVAPDELRQHAAEVGHRRALATTPTARSALDRARAQAEVASDAQRLAVLRATLTAPAVPVADAGAPAAAPTPQAPSPATSAPSPTRAPPVVAERPAAKATETEADAGPALVVGAGVLGALWLARRLLRGARRPGPG